MLILSWIKVSCSGNESHNRSGKWFIFFEQNLGLLCQTFLFFVMVKNACLILITFIAELTVTFCWIYVMPKNLKEFFIADDVERINYLHGFYLVLAIETIELMFIFFHHANLSFDKEQSISNVIITPALHRTHHSADRREHDSNYGIVLAVWDRLFGTRKESVPEKIGLDIIEAENFIQLFFLAFITERHVRKILQLIPKGKQQS